LTTAGFDPRDFVALSLPPSPARVLEVGCGRGELARDLAARGYEVVAIDPEAPQGAIFRRVALQDFEERGPFDAVVASRSLHHVTDLAGALDKLVGLLGPRGLLILNEHAWDRMDEPTARWFLDRWSATDPRAPGSLAEFFEYWTAEHQGLHGYAAMRLELDRRFAERFFAWTPYRHGELGAGADEAEQRARIEAGEIRATGFRYVGERLPASDHG
jgi:SAM-dependent methyltransferase